MAGDIFQQGVALGEGMGIPGQQPCVGGFLLADGRVQETPALNRPCLLYTSGLRETPGSNGFSSGNTQVIPAIRKNPAPRGTYPAPTAGGRPSQRPSGPPPYSPRQGGVRPSVMRETPPVQDARPQRPFVPPQKKQSAPPTDNREGRDGFSGRPPRP